MKILLFLFTITWGLLMLTPVSYSQGTLVEVQKLTEPEITELKSLETKVKEANQNLTNLKNRIAKDHKMENQTWMEWQVWYEIDGDYILKRHQSFMTPSSLDDLDHMPKFNLNDGNLTGEIR